MLYFDRKGISVAILLVETQRKTLSYMIKMVGIKRPVIIVHSILESLFSKPYVS